MQHTEAEDAEPQAHVGVVTELAIESYVSDARRVALPSAEPMVVARFGPSAEDGLDVHVLGGRHCVHRKHILGGQRAVAARLQLGSAEGLLGASAGALAGQTVSLAALWGDAAARRVRESLADASSTQQAARLLAQALASRAPAPHGDAPWLLEAARRLASEPVHQVADALGVSERHLRRRFTHAVGMSPKAYTKLARFRRAVAFARRTRAPQWAEVAARAGYYDQAHLIADFRVIAGVTPRALLSELALSHA